MRSDSVMKKSYLALTALMLVSLPGYSDGPFLKSLRTFNRELSARKDILPVIVSLEEGDEPVNLRRAHIENATQEGCLIDQVTELRIALGNGDRAQMSDWSKRARENRLLPI